MPTGSVDISARQNFAGGPVTCLTVTGNRATVGFAEVFRPGDGLDGGFLFVEDNGSPGAGRDAVLFNLVAEPPSVCPANTVAYGSDDRLYFGDIAVQDAQPSPTSKHQCKHGGWVQFGFKNQGQCVAFVQRRPQP
jgi:hypothetical protein